MQREFKFRAWSIREQCWCAAFSIHKSGLFSELINAKIENGIAVADAHWQDLSKQEDILINQFTGLYDKNGKEIYEGDILRENSTMEGEKSRLILILWKDGGFMYRNEHDSDFYTYQSQTDRCEVVGNAYENPALIGYNAR